MTRLRREVVFELRVSLSFLTPLLFEVLLSQRRPSIIEHPCRSPDGVGEDGFDRDDATPLDNLDLRALLQAQPVSDLFGNDHPAFFRNDCLWHGLPPYILKWPSVYTKARAAAMSQ